MFSPQVFITPSNILNKLSPPCAQNIFSSFFEEFLTGRTTFFTDGSKREPAYYVGLAIFSPALHLMIQKRITSYASIFTAEALAIITAIQLIIYRKIPKASIFSDSLSVLNSVLSEKQLLPANHLVVKIRAIEGLYVGA